jgi:creatinine amidohydrolase
MLHRNQGKAWDQHFLPRLSRKQIAEMDKEDVLIVQPIGAVEQHGAHLPTFTDTLVNESFLTYAFEALPDDAPIWLLPPLPYGKSTEHLGHSGTISLSATTLIGLLQDIARSLQLSGFRKLVFYNTHGGNVDVLNLVGREIRIETGLAVFHIQSPVVPDPALFPASGQRIDIHGGDVETSLVLAARPHWVDMKLAVDEFPQLPADSSIQLKSKTFAWIIDDLSDSGIVGYATVASKDYGTHLFERGGQALAKLLLECAAFDMKNLKLHPKSMEALQ